MPNSYKVEKIMQRGNKLIEPYRSVILRITGCLFDDKGMYMQGQCKSIVEFFSVVTSLP